MMKKNFEILADPTISTIENNMGAGGKVPSFYNNIAVPHSNLPIATVDTHSAGAATLFPGGGNDPVVYRAMGLPRPKEVPMSPRTQAAGAASTGAKGHYGLYNDMHVDAAKDLGMRPREVQSITWESVRNLWGEAKKTPGLKTEAERIWRKASTPQQARNELKALLGKGR